MRFLDLAVDRFLSMLVTPVGKPRLRSTPWGDNASGAAGAFGNSQERKPKRDAARIARLYPETGQLKADRER